MFQTIHNEDSIKLHLNVFIELSWSSGCSETEFCTCPWVRVPSWFSKDLHSTNTWVWILVLLPWLEWYNVWLFEAFVFYQWFVTTMRFHFILVKCKVQNCCCCCKNLSHHTTSGWNWEGWPCIERAINFVQNSIFYYSSKLVVPYID